MNRRDHWSHYVTCVLLCAIASQAFADPNDPPFGDRDADGDVDIADFIALQQCISDQDVNLEALLLQGITADPNTFGGDYPDPNSGQAFATFRDDCIAFYDFAYDPNSTPGDGPWITHVDLMASTSEDVDFQDSMEYYLPPSDDPNEAGNCDTDDEPFDPEDDLGSVPMGDCNGATDCGGFGGLLGWGPIDWTFREDIELEYGPFSAKAILSSGTVTVGGRKWNIGTIGGVQIGGIAIGGCIPIRPPNEGIPPWEKNPELSPPIGIAPPNVPGPTEPAPTDDASDPIADAEESTGDGLYLRLVDGNVWTTFPIVRTSTAFGNDLDFWIRYDSIRAQEHHSTLGSGWTHAYNTFLTFPNGGSGADPNAASVVFWQADGRRNHFIGTAGARDWVTPPGRAMTLAWDDTASQFVISFPNGTLLRFRANGKIDEIEDRDGRKRYFEYDAQSRLIEVVSPYGRVLTLAHWPDGSLKTAAGPDGEITTFRYTNDQLTEVEDPLGHTLEFGYEATTDGRLISEVLKNGARHEAEYHTHERELYVVDGSTGGRERVARLVRMYGSTPAYKLPDTRTERMRPGWLKHADGEGNVMRIRRDEAGRVLEFRLADGARWVREFGGRLAKKGNRARLIRVADARGTRDTYSWNKQGWLDTATDALGNVTTYHYEQTAPYRLREVTLPDGVSKWRYKYDAIGRIVKVIDPEIEDPQDPNRPYFTVDYIEYASDASRPSGVSELLPGRLAHYDLTDATGREVRAEFDGQGNVTRLISDRTNINQIREFGYDTMGRRTSVTLDPGAGGRAVSQTWDFDERGRLESTSTYDNGVPLTTSFIRDSQGLITRLIDPRGRKTHFDYDFRNRVKELRVDDGNEPNALHLTMTWGYNKNSQVTSVTDFNSATTTYVYDDRGLVDYWEDPEGYIVDYTYDPVGNVLRVDRQRGGDSGDPDPSNWLSIAYEYDELDRVVRRTVNPDGTGAAGDEQLVTEIDYITAACGCRGTAGRATPYRFIDAENKYTYLEYNNRDQLCKVIEKVGDTSEAVDGDDAVMELKRDAAGRVVEVIEPEGQRRLRVYDDAGRLQSVTKVADENDLSKNLVTTTTYDGTGEVDMVTMPNGTVYQASYDAANRLREVRINPGSENELIGSVTYDENGNILTHATALSGQVHNLKYDGAGRLTRLADPYDESDTFSYDGNGNLIEHTDRNGVRTAYRYDKLNRPTRKIRNFYRPGDSVDSNDLEPNTLTRMYYNGVNQIGIAAHDPAERTDYTYSNTNRLERIDYPLTNDYVKYGYDLVGNVTTRTTPDGEVATYQYDDLHQLTSRSYGLGTDPNESFTFDRSGRLVNATRDPTGSAISIGRVYDDADRVLAETLTFTATSDAYQTTFDYDVDSTSTRTISYPSGLIIEESYDARMRLVDIAGDPNNVLPGTKIGLTRQFDVVDRPEKTLLKNNADPTKRVQINRTFNLNDWLSGLDGVKDPNGAATRLLGWEFGFDKEGVRKFTRDLADPTRSELYKHDRLYRIRQVLRGTLDAQGMAITSPLNDSFLAYEQDWVLDRNGNWSEFKEFRGLAPATPTVRASQRNAANEYTSFTVDGLSTTPPNYDAKGNLVVNPLADNLGDTPGSPSGQTYTYDAENRLTHIYANPSNPQLLLEIEYDALGRRVVSTDYTGASDPNSQCSSGPVDPLVTRHVVAGLVTLEEHVECPTGGWTLAREFIWSGFPNPVAFVDRTNLGDQPANTPEVLHYLTDFLGSVVGLVDAGGDLVERVRYDTYGLTQFTDPTSGGAVLDASRFGNPFGFTGQRYDAGAKLYHFLFRSYDPRLGRWLQRDPAGYVDGVNLLEYVAGGPTEYTDPFGLMAWAKKDDEGGFWGWFNRALDNIQFGLDLAGFIPGAGIGELADGLNTAISLARGNYTDAAINAVALLPGGDLLKVAKHGDEAVGVFGAMARKARKAGKNADEVEDATTGLPFNKKGGGRNAQHGKAKPQPSQLAQIEELEKKLKNAKTRKEKVKIKTKIGNIRDDIAKKKKGTQDRQNPPGAGGGQGGG